MAFPPIDPNYGSLLGQAQPVQISGIKYKRVVELLPAFTFGRTQEATADSQGALVRNKELDINDLSLTGKLGMTSDLTLDATVNPDFSQVEADAGQVDFNLRYALYYEEKRPFFLEGSETVAVRRDGGGRAALRRSSIPGRSSTRPSASS